MAKLIISFGIEHMSPETKGRVIAPKIGELTSPNFLDIAAHRKYPLNTFIFNFELSLTIENRKRQFIFNIIRKSCDALDEYCAAVASLKEFIASPEKSLSPYFAAVREFEHCVAHIYQAVICMNALAATWKGQKQYDPGDGSILERLNFIHNDIKHMDERFEKGDGSSKILPQLPRTGDDAHGITSTIPMWLTNEGLESIRAKVTYHELAKEILEIHEEARKLAVIQRKDPYKSPKKDGTET